MSALKIKRKTLDFIVISIFTIGSFIFTIKFNLKPLITAGLIFFVPTIFLWVRENKSIKRILAGALIMGVGVGFILDFILSLNKAWDELSHQLIINYRLFGVLPLDEPIWFFLLVLYVLTFYEHFLDKKGGEKLTKKMLPLGLGALSGIIIILLFFFLLPAILKFSYAYFITAFLGSFLFFGLARKDILDPNLYYRYSKATAFFFLLYLVYELVAIKNGQWFFPGQYIGGVQFFGLQFPIEELIFWMVLSTPLILATYEKFIDDES